MSKMSASSAASRKFRFDSFASEFDCKEQEQPETKTMAMATPNPVVKQEPDLHCDNDSGIGELLLESQSQSQ